MKCLAKQITIRIIYIISFVICYLSTLPSQSYAQVFTLNHGLKRDGLSFQKIKNLIIIPIYINGIGPFDFLLDTGVDPLIITNAKLIDSLKINNVRPIKINGVGDGKEIDALFTKNLQVDISQAKIESIPTVILNEDVFKLSDFLGTKVYGIIGANFFNSFIVKINYQTNRIRFYAPNTKTKIKGTKIDLELIENKPYINTTINVDKIGNINAKLIVDCGASHALSLEAINGLAFPLPDANITGNLGIGLAGIISGHIGRINTIELGGYTAKKILTNFPNYEDVAAKTNLKERTGNLGADLLRRFNVTFDYQQKAMYLKKNNFFNEAYEHDMSGMEIYVDTDEYYRFFINRIEPNSPADKAGLLANDEIVAINFKDIRSTSLDELTSMLKSESGKTFVVEVFRKDKTFIKLITLKRRI